MESMHLIDLQHVMQVAGATYKAIEFAGSTLGSMNMEERMTLCNMAIEAGGKNGIIAPDATTFEYLDARKPDYEYTPVYADPDASYEAVYTVDVASLDPIVAAPHSPDNRKTAKECSSVSIDRSYIGSCTGIPLRLAVPCTGRVLLAALSPACRSVVVSLPLSQCTAGVVTCTSSVLVADCSGCDAPSILCSACLQIPPSNTPDLGVLDCCAPPAHSHATHLCAGGKTTDFHAAAQLLHRVGEQVAVPTFLVPATQQVWADVYSKPVPGCDGKTAAEIFQEAGCVTPAAPSCAACLGGPVDTFARVNEAMTVVSTTNRNFPGRMGHKDAQVYLASPYTAAASALAGRVCDPREFM